MNPTVVRNELVEARKKLDDVYEHVKKAMAYADCETYEILENARIKIIQAILDIEAVIERVE